MNEKLKQIAEKTNNKQLQEDIKKKQGYINNPNKTIKK